MARVLEIERFLFELAPRALAASWDNVGLLLGDPAQEVDRVLVALDVTASVAAEAEANAAELIVAHHPLMNCKWSPVQTIRADHPQGRLFRRLVRADVSVISMHTNLDAVQGGVNDVLAEAFSLQELCTLDEETGLGRVGNLAKSVDLKDFLLQVKETLGCNGLRYADAGRKVSRLAVGGGACGDFLQQALASGCDTFLTSDLSYHQFLDGRAMGLNLIDAGHFPTENLICPVVAQKLRQAFAGLDVRLSTSHREVTQYYV